MHKTCMSFSGKFSPCKFTKTQSCSLSTWGTGADQSITYIQVNLKSGCIYVKQPWACLGIPLSPGRNKAVGTEKWALKYSLHKSK